MAMEKDSPKQPGYSGRQPRRGLTVTAIIMALAMYFWWDRSQPLNEPPQEPPSEYHHTGWEAITPSEKLSWVPCFPTVPGNLLCARLTVPMDYNRPLAASVAHPKVHLALVMLPGEGHSLESGNFSTSPVIFNPGGPGGPGTALILLSGREMQQVVGRHHDLVSFDPRGIGESWPRADCFLDDHTPEDPPSVGERNLALLRRETFRLEMVELGLPNSTDKALGLTAAWARARSKLCGAKDGPDSIFRHAGTPNVARDLLSIVHAWDQWRDGLAASQKAPLTTTGAHEAGHQESSALDSTKGKLVYWGFSYGTFLGATFAAMFPDSVGRLVLDGVVDTDSYFRETYGGAIVDIDSVLDKFFQYCVEAGKKCHFYREDNGAEDVKRRYTQLMARIENEPLIIVPSHVRMPVVVRSTDLKAAFFRFMYFPKTSFPVLAALLSTIEQGLDMSPWVIVPDMGILCNPEFSPLTYPEESPYAIGCSDRRQHWAETPSELQKAFEKVAHNSAVFADYWMLVLGQCVGWDIKPVDPPEFNLDTFPTGSRAPINTSFPILFISNTFDPVTPLQMGLRMSQRYVNAGFIEQLSIGHCSLSADSLCTIKRIRAYLNEGLVPSPPRIDASPSGSDGRMTGQWEQCKSNDKPWGVNEKEDVRAQEDVEILEAWQQVRRGFRNYMGWHLPVPKVFRHLLDVDLEAVEDLLAHFQQ